MQKLNVDTSKDPLTPDVLLVLQLLAANEPFLPNSKTFKCEKATGAFIPFISLFLSPNTTEILIGFARGPPEVVVASMVSRFPALCPDLESITLKGLPRNSVIIDGVSEMVLACNRNTLRIFQVDSPLTEEARKVVYRLPRLTALWGVIQGPTSLPTVALPDLTMIDVEYEDDLNWLQGFRGARLRKLEDASFRTESNQIGDFLRTFEGLALTASAQNTLSAFGFYTSSSWNPNYSSLLSFTQLKELEIEFSCNGGCSSRVDDDIIISLARAMPKLEILQLGEAPCKTPTGITVNGLIGLASCCLHLSKLCVHFQAISLADAAVNAMTPSPSDDEPIARREDCALTDLTVGEIPIPAQSALMVTLILLQIFPRILNINYTNREWKTVAKTIKHFNRIGAFVHRSGMGYRSTHSTALTNVLLGDAVAVRRPSEDGQALLFK